MKKKSYVTLPQTFFFFFFTYIRLAFGNGGRAETDREEEAERDDFESRVDISREFQVCGEVTGIYFCLAARKSLQLAKNC